MVPISQSTSSNPVVSTIQNTIPPSPNQSTPEYLKRLSTVPIGDEGSKQIKLASDLVDLASESSESDDDIEELTGIQFYMPQRKRKPISEESNGDYELIDVSDSGDE